jgi:hypothetical protein
MADLIRKHLGDIPETAAVIELLARAMPASHERNLYVHGEWWRFNTESRTVTVRRSTIRPGEQPHVDFTAVNLDRLTETLKDIEVELFTRRRAIEAMRGNN